MNVTIEQAIEEITVLQTALKEGGFLHESLNMAKGALITIKDGDYQLKPMNVSRETLEEIASFDCTGLKCHGCKYYVPKDCLHTCMVNKAREILHYEQNIQEVEKWVKQNEKNL